jgi:PAS domain S-box-containing protein
MRVAQVTQSSVECPVEGTIGLTSRVIHILHVDDDAGFLKLTKDCLETKNRFKIDTATSVCEAWTKLENGEYDAIVADYQMREKDGLEFLKELREKKNNTPFIMFTGKGKEEVAIKAFNLGADRYINKIGDPETVFCELTQGILVAVERKKAEDELRESEIRYRTLVENAPVVIYTISGETGTLTSLNPTFEKMTGWKTSEWIGKSFEGLIYPDDLSLAVETFEQASRGENVPPYSLRILSKSGKYVVGEFTSKPHIKDGKVVGEFGIVHDVTERKKTEKRVLENQQKFERLFRGNPEASVYLDLEFHILDINPRFEELFGYKPDEIRGKNLDEVVVPKDLMEEAGMLNRNAEKGYVYYDTVRRRKNGLLVPVSISAATITVDGQLVGYVGVYKDISELRRTERDLSIMNEKLRVVGGLTRHDVRNKLAAIVGNVFLIKKHLTEKHEAIEIAIEIESACKQITRIFEFASAYERLGIEELAYVNVGKALDEAFSLFSDLHGIRVVNECYGLTVLADSFLRQLFYNLADNSLKYGYKIKTIRIHYSEKDQKELKLVFEDDGVGIPVAEKALIFKEGYGKGTGYGLYLIKKMVDVYDWTIQETGEPGEGAKFILMMPRFNNEGKTNYQIE